MRGTSPRGAWLARPAVGGHAGVDRAARGGAVDHRLRRRHPDLPLAVHLHPAVLAGCLFTRRGPEVRQLAGLGTGVVTVPLFTLSWALLIPPAGSVLAGVAGTLWLTGLLGVVPLL